MAAIAHPPGIFCWPELATTDVDAAARFYTSLFGWEAVEVGEGDHPYTLLRLDGLDAAGAYAAGDEPAPPHWNVYVAVASADAAAERAQALGGTQIAPPSDVMDIGRMAVLADPSGATFHVWEARTHIGARVLDVPGALCWTELLTTDLGAAEGFYSRLFGWRTERDNPAATYVEVIHQDKPVAGMLRIGTGQRSRAPHWMPYFAVADVDDTLAVARRHFGTLLAPPADLPTVGRFAVLRDPLGAAFGIFGVNEAA
jgi:uncharacterized protein